MHLSCKTMFVAAIVATLACHDLTTAPIPPAGYALENVNGRPLPTFVSPIPEAPTIISASMQLNTSREATLTEHRLDMGAEVTYTTNYTYKISGNQIEFDYNPPCPPNALCAAPPRGTLNGSLMSLAMYGASSGIVFNFRFVAPE